MGRKFIRPVLGALLSLFFASILGAGAVLAAEQPVAPALPAQPLKALFYPDEVELAVEEKLPLKKLPEGGLGFAITLPGGVRPDTLSFTINGQPAYGYYWAKEKRKPLPPVLPLAGASGDNKENSAAQNELLDKVNKFKDDLGGKDKSGKEEEDPIRRALMGKLDRFKEDLAREDDATFTEEEDPARRLLLLNVNRMKDEVSRKEGQVAAGEQRIAIWGGQPGQPDQVEQASQTGQVVACSAEDIIKLDKAAASTLPELHRQLAIDRRNLEFLQEKLAKAEADLAEYDQEEGVAGKLQTVYVPFEGADSKEGATHTVRYSYVMPARCGYSYRVEALPGDKKVFIAQEAELYQNSGLNWEGVELFISTARRDASLDPGHISPWRIEPMPENVAGAAMPAPAGKPVPYAARMSKMAEAPEQDAYDAAQRVVVEDMSTFRLWSLGKRQVATRRTVRLPMDRAEYAASFLYTLRPHSRGHTWGGNAGSPRGFLTAELKLPQALDLPMGTARFFVDGSLVGAKGLTLNGDKASLYFGSDPQVSVSNREIERKSGEDGLINKDKTLLWQWEYTLQNSRKYPVEVVLETPAPIVEDEKIRVTEESKPKPEEAVNPQETGGAKLYRWKITLKPGEPVIVNHKVRVAAPEDMRLQPGYNP